MDRLELVKACIHDWDRVVELCFLPTQEIDIERRYQRRTVESMVTHIVEEFNPTLFGAITVFQRGKKYFVTDGQHRLLAARKLKLKYVPCLLFQSDGLAGEALNFCLINRDRKPVSTLEQFKAGVIGKDEECVNILRIVREYGIGINVPGLQEEVNLSCVSTVRKLYCDGNLSACLSVITEAWPEYLEDALGGDMMAGFWHVLSNNSLERDRLVNRLKRVSPVRLLNDARRLMLRTGYHGRARTEAMSAVLLRQYRKKR